MEEEKLNFGFVSAPVKIGNTVHRQIGPWTPTIHSLLSFLQSRGFMYSQKVLGFDEQGREILEFLSGDAATRPWPSQILENDGLVQAATVLKQYHAVVKDFQPPKDAEWGIGKVPLKPGQIIRHGDLGPWNTLWQKDKLTGLVDWDFAEPGGAITDLAQMAYYFVPLRGEKGWQEAGFTERPNFLHRLSTLCETYGQFTTSKVLAELQNWLHEELRRMKELGEKQGLEPWLGFSQRGDADDIREDLTWLEELNREFGR